METDNQQNRIKDDAAVILNCLRCFNIGINSIKSSRSANVTLYELKPSMGVRISKIRNLKDELAVALAVPSVRIIAPTPNGAVGIEVPNRERELIDAREALMSPDYSSESASMTLPLLLGRTSDNRNRAADLTLMPHILVAGATGQGKSVCLNVMLMSLLKHCTPDEMKLILIDPKRVELSIYEALNSTYLAAPIITESDHAYTVLESLCTLMDFRYELLQKAGKRNILEYNSLEGYDRMPYIVVVIDEYGDLIMTSGKEMEHCICRLAQKARAVGIHLILSTQRPSVDVVTGNIKANFLVRIAFRTTTGTDSRVILGQTGAEKLTGRGDMLYYSGTETTRMQCAYADTEDVENVCADIQCKYAGYKNTHIFKIGEQYKPTGDIVLSEPLIDGIRDIAHAAARSGGASSPLFLFDNLGKLDRKYYDMVLKKGTSILDQLVELGLMRKEMIYHYYWDFYPNHKMDQAGHEALDRFFDNLEYYVKGDDRKHRYLGE